jgi:hypothetical protein
MKRGVNISYEGVSIFARNFLAKMDLWILKRNSDVGRVVAGAEDFYGGHSSI